MLGVLLLDIEPHPVEVFNPDSETLTDFFSRYIYRRFMLPRIRKMLQELLSEDPSARLANSSLQELYKHMTDWRLLYVRLTTMLMSLLSAAEVDLTMAAAAMRIINAIAVMQDMGFRLKKLAPMIREESSGRIGVLDELLKEKEAEAVLRSGSLGRQNSGDFLTVLQLKQVAEEETLQAELKKVKERHQKRTVTYVAMESLIVGWEQLKDDPAAFELIESLAKCLFHTDKTTEVLDFIRQLKPAASKEDKSSYKR